MAPESCTSADGWGDLTANQWGLLGAGISYRNTYSWDPTGNRVLEIKDGNRTTSTFDPANQNVFSEDASGRTTYTFDATGNRTVVEKPDGSRTTTTYDYENRNIRIILPTSIVNTMQYDPDGLRVQLDASSGTTKFVYDNQQYLLEIDGSNTITAVYTQEPGNYSNLVSQYRYTGSMWVPSYYHYDSLGSCRHQPKNVALVGGKVWRWFFKKTRRGEGWSRVRSISGCYVVAVAAEIEAFDRRFCRRRLASAIQVRSKHWYHHRGLDS